MGTTEACPSHFLQSVGAAELVVTLGRYHPAVFALMAGVPCVCTGDKVPFWTGAFGADANSFHWRINEALSAKVDKRRLLAEAKERLSTAWKECLEVIG